MNVKQWLLTIFLLPFTLSAQITGLAGWDVYLDPGHSRTENMGIYNYSEAQKNLRVSLNIIDLLLSTTDIDTVWSSRYNDNVQVSLSQRTDEANSLGASWYHSIHSNAGSPSSNNTLMLWGQYQNGAEKVPNGGKAMSSIMLDLLTRTMRIATIGSWGDCTFYGCTFTGPYLHVNRNSFMPSELSEAGFHTSPLQNTRNMNAAWKRMEAYAFYYSFLKFHNIPRPPVGILAGYINDLERNIPLNGATVSVNGQEYTTDTFASLFHQYTTDPDLLHNGFYFFENMSIDTLEMIVSADGFESDTLTVAISDTFITFKDVNLIDARPPGIVSTTPADSAVNIDVFDDVIINFSRRMDRASVEAALSLSPAAEYSLSWQSNNRKLIVNPVQLAQETEYTLTIADSATDLFSHPLDGNGDGVAGDPFTLIFITQEADITAPQITGEYPPQNAVAVERAPIINLEFDEEIVDSTVTENSLTLENTATGQTVTGTLKHYVVGERSALSFFPDAPLDLNTNYLARLQPGLKDLFGNEVQNEQTFVFTTGDFDYNVTSIDNFQSGILNNWWDPQQSGTTTGIITTQTSRGNNTQFVNLLTGSTRSMRLQYGWDESASSWLIREFLNSGAPRDVWFDKNNILQVYIFGNGGNSKFRFAVDDAVPNGGASNHEVSEWITIDWVGWRLVSWDLANDPIGSWIGNGVLEGTLRIDSFQLTYEPGANLFGKIYFDDLRIVNRVVVGINDDPVTDVLPKKNALAQNYPNPFNPSTTIRFSVAEKTQRVKVMVYDMLGRVVATLVDEQKSPGNYVVQWNGKTNSNQQVASGTYLYTLSVGNFTQTRKMLLLK